LADGVYVRLEIGKYVGPVREMSLDCAALCAGVGKIDRTGLNDEETSVTIGALMAFARTPGGVRDMKVEPKEFSFFVGNNRAYVIRSA
jgi:hypothetical protein